jgi:tetratricopeptide (TPR) repeat protein
MARQMSVASGGGKVVQMPFRGWILRAAAAAVLVAGVGWWAWDHWIANDPVRLIAKAYTQQRPFVFRIPGAANAPVRVERGSVGSSFRRPASLAKAEGVIAGELEKDPDSVKWLDLKARAEMMGWDPEAAISTLQRALERKPDDPDLMADLGVAYALRAEAQKRDVDYGYAIEYLGRSLKAKPNAPEAIFNRAVVYEQMFLYDQAIREWRHYLELDPSGGWREEAQSRLSELEQKKKPARQP